MDYTPGTSPGQGDASTGMPTLDEAKDQAMQMAGEAKQVAGRYASQAMDQVKTQVSDQKERLVGAIDSVADSFRHTSSALRDQDQAVMGDCMAWTANMAEQVSHYLREHEVQDLVSEVENYARRNPTVFFAGAFALGFFAVRFFKSSGSKAGSGSMQAQENGRYYRYDRPASALSESDGESTRPISSAYQRAMDRSEEFDRRAYGTYSGTESTYGTASEMGMTGGAGTTGTSFTPSSYGAMTGSGIGSNMAGSTDMMPGTAAGGGMASDDVVTPGMAPDTVATATDYDESDDSFEATGQKQI